MASGAGALSPSARAGSTPAPRKASAQPDVIVIGAGVFGAWTAWHLQNAGRQVLLLDAYGPGNSRASSGGETRVIRMGYGADETYTRWSQRSLGLWKELEAEAQRPVFVKTGVLWMTKGQDALASQTLATLGRLGIAHEKLDRAEMDKRWPQIDFGESTWATYEPDSGALMARRAVQTVVARAIAKGASFATVAIQPPDGKGRQLAGIVGAGDRRFTAGTFVFACGPWLPKVFPELVGRRIFPTRQEVFYFGPPSGDHRFASPAMPTWIDFGSEIYGLPDIESKGFKVAPDKHGEVFDPDTGERVVSDSGLSTVREFVARRFPALKNAPVVASEVCQYENTSNGDFLIDRHPDYDNVWLVGGGSGHGFKHGPAVGEYVAARLADRAAVDAKFSLATKAQSQNRTVF